VSRAATIEQLLGHLPRVFAPGERNQYCNGCYIALWAIVERVSGMPYEKYVAEKVFAPAGTDEETTNARGDGDHEAGGRDKTSTPDTKFLAGTCLTPPNDPIQ
jgi:CubicO group peptidase (beta-lactamase class C family)